MGHIFVFKLEFLWTLLVMNAIRKSGRTDKSCEETCRLQFHRVLVHLQSGHKRTLVIYINNYSET